PAALFVVDVSHEKIAVAEAARCGIPCVALVDTNSDPATVSHPIPGNDDAVKSIRIIVETITNAIQNGLAQRGNRGAQRTEAKPQTANLHTDLETPDGEVDLSRVELPAEVAAAVEGETEAPGIGAKRKIAP